MRSGDLPVFVHGIEVKDVDNDAIELHVDGITENRGSEVPAWPRLIFSAEGLQCLIEDCVDKLASLDRLDLPRVLASSREGRDRYKKAQAEHVDE